jgi:hypothetical protein
MAAQRAQAEEQGSLEDRVWCVSGMFAEGVGLFPVGVDGVSGMVEERRRGGSCSDAQVPIPHCSA